MERIYEIVCKHKKGDYAGRAYYWIMFAAIVASLVPLAFRESNVVFEWIEKITVVFFIVDYILRLLTARYKLKKGARSYWLYPFTPLAVIDLLAILPALHMINRNFKLLKGIKLMKALRAFEAVRLLKVLRYFEKISKALRKQRNAIIYTVVLFGVYIILAALVMFNIETQAFDKFTQALYWSATALVTMGYGGIQPVSEFGRIVSWVSSFVTGAVIAEITIIVTMGFLHEHRQELEGGR